MMAMIGWALTAAVAAAGTAAAAVQVVPAPDTARTAPLPMQVGGRAVPLGDGSGVRRQWPGSYFETAFRGQSAGFRIGPGEVALHVLVDGRPVATLVKPAGGLYRLTGLAAGDHRLRVEVASESQAGTTDFGGFFAGPGTLPAPLPVRTRRIEFIGDSHTVGYANTSHQRQCTQDQIWATTDASQGLGPALARRYDADYRINAISGRGIVRNYNGFVADTLPQAYPFALFDHLSPANDAAWHPQVIVVALGTNDFTTPLHEGERWATRDALHADYEASYLKLVRTLRARDPHAFLILWATNMADGEIEAEVTRVVAALRAGGERRLAYVPFDRLAFSSCNSHPSVADDAAIAAGLAGVIDAQPDIWRSSDRS